MATQHALDRRQIQAQRLPEVEQRARKTALRIRAWRIQLAKDLAAIDECAAYVYSGCASISEYGQGIGLDRSEARTLCDAGRAMSKHAPFGHVGGKPGDDGAPTGRVERALLEGSLTLAAASCLGRLMYVPSTVRPDDDWVQRARRIPLRSLRREISARMEEVQQRAPSLVELSFHVTERTRDRFDRVRTIECDKAKKSLTEGQVFTRMVDDHLARHDVLAKTPRARRMGPTALRPSTRAIPAEVRRAILDRADGRCEVPGCEHARFLQFCHFVPFRDQAGQEVEDVFLGCARHHTQYDAGLIRFAGWSDAEKGERRVRHPRFETAEGKPLNGQCPALPAEDKIDGAEGDGTEGDHGVVRERSPPIRASREVRSMPILRSVCSSRARPAERRSCEQNSSPMRVARARTAARTGRGR